jgi:hypothetical protein
MLGARNVSAFGFQEVEANTELGVRVGGLLIPAGLVVRILVLLITASLSALCVEQAKAVGHGRLLGRFPGRHRCWNERRAPEPRECNIALIFEVPDFAAFVLHPRRHASASKRGVADGVRVDIGVGSTKPDVNDDKLVDVLHVLTDSLLGQAFRGGVADQNVASDATCELLVDVAIDTELTVCPVDVNLEECQRVPENSAPRNITTHPLALEVDIVAFAPSKEISSTSSKGH